MPTANRVWKLIGLASVVGVVATGALVARDERDRRSYTPEEVRDRLRARLDEADPTATATATATATQDPTAATRPNG